MAITKLSLILLANFALFFSLANATHFNHARMVKKRQLLGINLGIGDNVPKNPNSPTDPAGSVTADDNSNPATTQGTVRGAGGINIGVTLPNILGGGNNQSPTTTTTSTTIAAVPTVPPPPTTQLTGPPVTTTSAAQEDQPLPPITTTSSVIVFSTRTPDPLPTTTTDPTIANQGNIAKKEDNSTRNMVIIIIASVAGGIGVIALLWTIFRKWKLSPSDQFEERLNPIDWQPTGGMAEHHRAGSLHSNRSIHPEVQAKTNFISDLPSHDFTAGPAGGGRGLAPVGGYADLHRGPSPVQSDRAPRYGGYGY